MNALELINIGETELRQKKIDSFRLDSELLLSKILNKKREQILINLDQEISQKKFSRYKKLIQRRSNNEPIAYIMEEKEFWSKNFFVNRNTLIPRPETELLCDIVIKVLKNKNLHILDIGTGLDGYIFILDLLHLKFRKIKLNKRKSCICR